MKETIYLLIFLFLLLIFHDLCITIKEGMSNNNTKAEQCKKEADQLSKADKKIYWVKEHKADLKVFKVSQEYKAKGSF